MTTARILSSLSPPPGAPRAIPHRQRSPTLRLRCAALAAAASVVACGPPKEVVAFSVTPSLVCPGRPATVQWDVRGRARLRAERGPDDWDDGEVPSRGSREVAPTVTTTFTVTALEANPAAGQSYASQSVQVPSKMDRERAAPAPCQAGTCTGTFTIAPSLHGAKVATVSAPSMMRLGTTKPVQLVVTHGAWSATVPAGGTVQAGVLAEGPWTLSMVLAAGEPESPPPQLRITLDFDCH